MDVVKRHLKNIDVTCEEAEELAVDRASGVNVYPSAPR